MSDFKKDAAREALTLVESGMFLGLGTGSTAEEFVRLLGERIKRGELNGIGAVCTSERTEALARSLGILCEPFVDQLPDLAIDGADEIDSALRLVKGRGGALLREKIIEQASARFVVIADESKLVDRLGVGPFPIETVQFATNRLIGVMDEFGWEPRLRVNAQTEAFLTDERHHIIDISVPSGVDLAEIALRARALAGVVETGFFPTEATEAIVAGSNGITRMARTRSQA